MFGSVLGFNKTLSMDIECPIMEKCTNSNENSEFIKSRRVNNAFLGPKV